MVKMVFLNRERPSLVQRSNTEWDRSQAVRIFNANIMEIEEKVRVSTGCLHMKAKYQVKLERMKALSTTQHSQHEWPILRVMNLHIYLWFPTSPVILLSSLLLVDRDAVPSSLLLWRWGTSPGWFLPCLWSCSVRSDKLSYFLELISYGEIIPSF